MTNAKLGPCRVQQIRDRLNTLAASAEMIDCETTRNCITELVEIVAELTRTPQAAIVATGDVTDVIDHYRQYKPRSRPHKSEAVRSKVAARLRDGFSVGELKAAIDGCFRSTYHQGDNPNGRKYDSLELILRNPEKVTQFMEIPNQPRPAGRLGKNLEAGRNWAGR